MPKSPADRVLYLNEKPVETVCPSCWEKSYTHVEFEPATFCQTFIYYTGYCWRNRDDFKKNFQDVNHYCGKCGCFVGRMLPASTYLTKNS